MINQIKALPAFDDNYIWSLLGDDNKTLCVVDPGDPTPVIKMIEEQSLTLGCIREVSTKIIGRARIIDVTPDKQ